MRTLKLSQIEEADARCDQVELFEELFGSEVEVSISLARKHYDKFDWNWAANNLLSVSAWAEYKKVEVSAWAEYKKVEAPALAEYEKATAPALAEYKKATASARAKYKKAIASTWAKLYLGEK